MSSMTDEFKDKLPDQCLHGNIEPGYGKWVPLNDVRAARALIAARTRGNEWIRGPVAVQAEVDMSDNSIIQVDVVFEDVRESTSLSFPQFLYVTPKGVALADWDDDLRKYVPVELDSRTKRAFMDAARKSAGYDYDRDAPGNQPQPESKMVTIAGAAVEVYTTRDGAQQVLPTKGLEGAEL